MKLRLAFFGTPEFSARLLEKIIADKTLPVEVVMVVTQPDKPVGRKQQIEESPVKQIAKKFNIPVFDDLNQLRITDSGQFANIDLALVYAYGKIIPASLLILPRLGFWNLHPSLLPYYRGPSPTAYPLLLGDKITGVTLMKMDEKMDHGPIIGQVKYKIPFDICRSELEFELTNLGFELFKKNLLIFDKLKPTPQNHRKSTYTQFLTKQDGFIAPSLIKKALGGETFKPDELPLAVLDYKKRNNLSQLEIVNSAEIIFNLWRGLTPWPGLWTIVKINGVEKRLKLINLSLDQLTNGALTSARQGRLLTINTVQLEGKKEVDFNTFNKAYSYFKP